MRRARQERGIGLIEVVVTILVATVGLLVTAAAITQFGEAGYEAQRRSAMVSLAQRELERIRSMPYALVGLSAAVEPSAATFAPLPAKIAAEPLVSGGTVRPGGDPVSLQGASLRVYRYVTWRRQACPLVKARVASQLGAGWGLTQEQVELALGDLCPGTRHTKRVTVVVVAPNLDSHQVGRPAQTVTLTSVVADPHSTIGANGSFQGLEVDAAPVLDPVTGPDAGPAATYQTVSPQQWHLYDTPCSETVRRPPSGDHPSNDTASSSAGCTAGAAAHDLMGPDPVPGLASDPLHDVSTDVHRPMRGGLAIRQDSRHGDCTQRLTYPDGDLTERGAIHTWASPASTQPFATADAGGRATVTFWTQTASGEDRAARLCFTLRRSDTGAVLGSTEYALPLWPDEPTQLAVAFDVAAAALPAGARLLLTLRNPSVGETDVIVLYDHPAYPSGLSVTMKTGSELR